MPSNLQVNQKDDERYVPVHVYAKSHDLPVNAVYRWIRESKFDKEDVIKVKILHERLRIKRDAKIK